MTHDVFISHSSLDKLAADAVCHGLEAKSIRCWMAPRDQIAGKPYGQQITEAIQGAKVMVLVFSENVNRSQGVLNEINIAAGANVTIVPFRLASVEFSPELHYYLGRTHWLDAFPQPVDAYIDALAATVQRNLPPTPAADAAPAPPPPQPQPGPAPAPQPAPQPAPIPPPTPNHLPLVIAGGVFALVVLLALAASLGRKTSPAQEQATNTIAQAVANAIQSDAKDDDQKPAQGAAAGAAAPPHGDGSELTPVAQANPGAVAFYENELQPGGPPAALDGATVITTGQLVQSMRERDAGSNPFWLIDARGCSQEPTIPTAVCLAGNSIQELEAKAPNKATQLVVFCHDGACPMSFNLASQAVAAGYSNVFWYRGGVNAWAASGEPTVNRIGGGQ
jgi:rhodanese-related sulfurtransferase